jgi:2-oxoglutarate dehydrogenase E2 component (dihydrolipoamide succinyltransferase)
MSLIDIKVPTIGESINEVTLAQWLKADGDFVQMDEVICEFESDKATLEFPVPASGKLVHVAKEGEDLEIGAIIARVDSSVQGESDSAKPAQEATRTKDVDATTQTKSSSESAKKTVASPLAAKMMEENALPPQSVTGTGRDGRITKADVEAALTPKPEEKEPTPTKEATKPEQVVATSFSRNIRREKMSRMRRTISRRLVSAKNNTAMLTTFNEVDMSAIFALRSTYQDAFVKKHGIKLGFMSLFAKACAQVLMEMPEINARLEEEDLIYHDYADISIAISTPNGLVVPPVHNVESLSLHEIEYAIKALADKARTGKLSLEEMSGGTFTITNGGVFGSLMSTPILNEPQSAILGMHAIKERPIVVDGEIKIRPMMYLAMSYDHRVIDGSSSVTFLVKVKELLEDPVRFMLAI